MPRFLGTHFAPRSGFHGANAAAGEHRQPRSPQTPAAAINMSGRTISGGIDNRSPAYGTTQYIGTELPKLPSNSLNAAPIDDDTRERAAKIFVTVFLSLCFFVPLMLAGIMLHFK